MAKKLNSMPSYTANLPREAHDLSQSIAFTTCPSLLSPVYYDLLHFGDKLHFSASEFVRLNPLESQPLGKIDVHLDYFFVPLSVLYTPCTSMFYQTDDLLSSVFGGQNFDSVNFPVYDFSHLFDQLSDDGTPSDVVTDTPWFTKYVNTGMIRYNHGAFDCLGKSMFRLFDFLDMSPDALLDAIGLHHDSPALKYISDLYPNYTPWFALAYQCIYQNYFRNDDREPKNYHYNIDRNGALQINISENLSQDKSIFQMNYASRPKDYFNSVKVSPMYSSVSMLNAPGIIWNQVNDWINTSLYYPAKADSNTSSGDIPDNSTITQVAIQGVLSNRISSGKIRQLFMVDKLLRVVGRAEKNYESQFLAHFGIKVPHDALHNITHIGHDMMTITPESVISSANTYNGETGSALGEIGGKGSGMLSGRKHHFEAPFHGVFMVISHIVPRQRYVLGLNKLHQLSKITDFYQPEFDKKGMQPLFAYEAMCDMAAFNDATFDFTKQLGWQFAYEQFKRKADRVSRAFSPSRETNYGVNTYAPWVMSTYPFGQFDFHSDNVCFWVDNGGELNPSDLLLSPTCLNVNMVQPYDTRWPSQAVGDSSLTNKPWLIYQTDPFICDFNLYIKKVNSMSEYGEPEL